MKMIRVILLLVLAVHGVFSASCQMGWHELNGHCYSISNEAVSWLIAAGTCLYYKSTLVQIDSQTENNFLIGQMNYLNIDKIWLAGTTRHHQAVWEWVPSWKRLDFQNWAPGQPSNPETEKCMELARSQGNKWNDANCLTDNFFACEKPIENTRMP